jgi:hypothetical protein
MAKTQQTLDADRTARVAQCQDAASAETTRVHGNSAKGKATTSVTMEVATDLDGEQRTAKAKVTVGVETDETGPAPKAPATPAGGDKK